MKKLFFYALWAILYVLSPLTGYRTAKADAFAPYAYIPTESVYFYSDESSPQNRQGLFRLPYSYYVRVLSEDADFYRIEYLTDGTYTRKITGYCKKSEVILVDYIPEMPYLYLNIDVTYTLSGGGKDNSFSTITVTCAYYGDYTDGTKLYAYVLREDVFGYVSKPETLRYEKNTEYEEKTKPEQLIEEQKTKEESSLSVGQITLLVLLCLLIPCVAALIIRPSAKQPPYDDGSDP